MPAPTGTPPLIGLASAASRVEVRAREKDRLRKVYFLIRYEGMHAVGMTLSCIIM